MSLIVAVLSALLHRQHEHRPAVPATLLRPADRDVAVSIAGRDAYLTLEERGVST